jgi:polyisoprenoid-binding protein YceI
VADAVRFLSVILAWLCVASVACAQPPAWVVDAGASELRFGATFERAPAPGRFRTFDATIRFAPDRLAEATIEVVVATASADMGSAQVNDAIRGRDWLDVAAFPTATFRSRDVQPRGDGRFVARGTLTVKNVGKAVEVPIAWKAGGDAATMSGEVTVDRRAFDVGRGEWRATDAIGADVVVSFVLRLRKGG